MDEIETVPLSDSGRSGELSDRKVLESWGNNTEAWTRAVRERKISSRVAVTDRAIVDRAISLSPKSVLDLGCGEGWLSRALAAAGIAVLGVDAVPGLIDKARMHGGAEFALLPYEKLSEGFGDRRFELALCNFSLIGKESVESVFRSLPDLLAPGGAFVVQTLHPLVATGQEPYVDGWRPGSWAGFGPEFSDPPPWYFRTIGSWVELFVSAGFRLESLVEPLDPASARPASLILTGRLPP